MIWKFTMYSTSTYMISDIFLRSRYLLLNVLDYLCSSLHSIDKLISTKVLQVLKEGVIQ